MLPHEAMSHAAGSHRKEVAIGIGVTRSAVDKMCVLPQELGGEGRKGPIHHIVEMSLIRKASGDRDWQEPARIIARELHGVFVACPEDHAVADLEQAERLTKEFAELLGVIVESRKAGIISISHAERILSEGEDVISATFPIIRDALRLVVTQEASLYADRKGPRRVHPRITELREAALA
jgi:hypothetical protein